MSANRKLLDRYVERYNAGDLDGSSISTMTPCRTCRTAPSWPGRDPRPPRPGTDRVPGRQPHGAQLRRGGRLVLRRVDLRGNAHGFAAAAGRRRAGSYRQAGRGQGMEFCGAGDDGKLIVNTLYYDNLSVLAQLGLVPRVRPRNAGGEQGRRDRRRSGADVKEETCRSRCSDVEEERHAALRRCDRRSRRGFILGCAALLAALASDAIDLGGSDYIDVNGGSGAWTALGLVIVGSLAALGGTIAAVVSWIGALLNTWQLDDKMWFVSLLAGGLLGLGVVAMIAYVVAGPDGTKQSVARPGIAGAPARDDR